MSKSMREIIGAENTTKYYALIAKIESNNNPLAKNPRSTASGLYQPIKSTWTSYGFAWADVFDVAKQNEFIERFTLDNAKTLIRNGCAVNFATLYGSHFLGVNGLLSVMRASPNDPIEKCTSAAQRNANPTILKGTVRDFCNWLENKTGQKYTLNLANHPISPPAAVIPQKVAPMNWANSLVFRTIIQYVLAAIGGYLVNVGKLDAAQWETISGGLLIIIGLGGGAIAAATEKVVVAGQVTKLADLNPQTVNALIREAGK